MTITDIRHYLHQHPELSGCEQATHNFIVEQLRTCVPAKIYQHAGAMPNEPSNGVVAIWGTNSQAPVIAFRADIDALPINETNNIPYCSQRHNVAHKCGHDGHTTILLRLAQLLANTALTDRRIALIFQPEEETGKGAKKILHALKALPIQAIFGIHNLPGFPLGQPVLIRHTFAAASSGFRVHLQGRQTHASTPEKGINPGLAVAELVKRFDAFNMFSNLDGATDTLELAKFQQSTLIYIEAGEEAYGTSAGEAVLAFTLRAFTNDTMQHLLPQAASIVRDVASKYLLNYSIELREPFNATENVPEIVDALERHIDKRALQCGAQSALIKDSPFRWSEDFADYLMQYSGALFGIGSGTNHIELHHPDYDFPDDIIESTAQLFFSMVQAPLLAWNVYK